MNDDMALLSKSKRMMIVFIMDAHAIHILYEIDTTPIFVVYTVLKP